MVKYCYIPRCGYFFNQLSVTNFQVLICHLHGSHMDWKTWKKMGKLFPVREKSRNFEQTGKSGNFTRNPEKMMQFYSKYWRN